MPGQRVRPGVPRMVALTFRTAREADLERLLEVHTSAFPDPRGPEPRVRNFMRNPLGCLDDLWVASLEGGAGAIVAHAFLFPLEAWFGGARVPVAGIASIGVAPEARGTGVGTALLRHLCSVARERAHVAVLYAFRQGFYARCGFASTSSYKRLRLHPASIPWALEMRARVAAGSDRAAMEACWEDTARRRTGSLARTESMWEHRLADHRRVWLVVEDDHGVQGCIAWSLAQAEPHAHTALLVEEMAARSPHAQRSLWALLGRQRDQVAEVRVDVSADDPVDRALIDPDRGRFGDAEVEHVLGELAAGPMVSILDVEAGLGARGWEAEGTLVLEVQGSRYRMAVKEGRAAVERSPEPPDLVLDRRALSAIAYGALGARDAARLGLLAARDERTLALADALFHLPPYFSPDPY